MRASGILMPVASLPGNYGIGGFTKEAYAFVDFLEAAGQRYWQVLPMGPTGYGDSPYQSFSTFAGNPYFIDLDALCEKGWLKKSECSRVNWGSDAGRVDYEKIYKSRFKVLKKAYERSGIEKDPAFKAFVKEQAWWLEGYVQYMAIKEKNGGKSFAEWEDSLRTHKAAAVKKAMADPACAECAGMHRFIQYLFYSQWAALKDYANKKGILVIGDIPIYVAYDSADTWANPELFQLDKKGQPTGVAGCPPDPFAVTGQLWGNPLYDWEYHKKTGYEWWIRRLRMCFTIADVVRIDHFRGFDEYYNIPYGDPTAENGKWVKGPGYEFFAALKKAIGKKPIIAEDLGFLTKSVIQLVKKTGYPGMKILEFAFDSGEESDYMPHNYIKNSVVYTGTHDNDTVVGWFGKTHRKDKECAKKYLNVKNGKHIAWDMIRLAMASVSETAIIPIQDYLELGSEARINIPSTLGGNWDWRMEEDALTPELAARIRDMATTYGRVNN